MTVVPGPPHGRRRQSIGDAMRRIQDMRDRVEAVDGGLVAASEVGRGTVISGWVPARAVVGAG